MRYSHHQAEGLDVGIRKYFRKIVDLASGHILVLESAQPVLPACTAKYRAQLSVQHVVVLDARPSVAKSLIVVPSRPLDRTQQALPEFLRRRQMNDEREAVTADECKNLSRVGPSAPGRELPVFQKPCGIFADE